MTFDLNFITDANPASLVSKTCNDHTSTNPAAETSTVVNDSVTLVSRQDSKVWSQMCCFKLC